MNVSVKNIQKVAWAQDSETFAPTFTLCLEAEKKAVEASFFEISCTSKMDLLEASVANSVGYRKIRSLS